MFLFRVTLRWVKERFAAFQELLLPLTHLVRMRAELTGNFVERLQTLGGFEGDLEFEFGAVAPAGLA